MTFQLESELVGEFQSLLASDQPFSQLELASEFYYREGQVDLIGFNCEGELFCFEAKLSKWRAAMNQAYRNTSFSHYSYVVLPASSAKHALKWRREFERRGIGLCSVTEGRIAIEIQATRKTPLLPWLTDSAMAHLKAGGPAANTPA